MEMRSKCKEDLPSVSSDKRLPTGEVYVRGIFVEHSHDIFPEYLEKVPYEILGNIHK